RWSKTSSVFARPRATSAVSLKPASKPCTTSFLSPAGGDTPSSSDFIHSGLLDMVAPLKVGIAGLGTVGAEVVRLLSRQAITLASKSKRSIKVVAVTARSKTKKRGLDLRSVKWANNPVALAGDPDIDCLVELIGGADGVALQAVETALRAGKSVVTANK